MKSGHHYGCSDECIRIPDGIARRDRIWRHCKDSRRPTISTTMSIPTSKKGVKTHRECNQSREKRRSAPSGDIPRFPMLAVDATRHVSDIFVQVNVGLALTSTFSWPTPRDGTVVPKFTRFRASLLAERFGVLPTELLLEIFSRLPIPSLLALSAPSRSLRALITEPHFLNQVLKAAVLGGSAFWILPVRTIPGEEKRAEERGVEWLGTVRGVRDGDQCFARNRFHTFPSYMHATNQTPCGIVNGSGKL